MTLKGIRNLAIGGFGNARLNYNGISFPAPSCTV